MLQKLREIGIALIPPFLAAAIGGVATAGAIPTWYRTLEKPAWNPPDWIFGPVWTVLYIMMGIASWQVWRLGTEKKDVRDALGLYGAQLVLNTAWSLLFFGMRRIGLALGEIVALWALIAATVTKFYRLKKSAGLLLVPYLLWVSFAAILNARIWQLNQ